MGNLMYGVMLSVILAILSCGRDEVRQKKQSNESPPVETQSQEAKAVLAVFGGYTCPSCNEELPELQHHLDTVYADRRFLVQVDTYVVFGENGGSVNQAVADAYGKKLGIGFNMIPDFRCKTHYAKYYPGDWKRCLVPAAVLMKKDGTIVKNFGRGKVNLDELTQLINQVLDEKP